MKDDSHNQRPGETAAQWRRRLEQLNFDKTTRLPGNYYSTQNADGSSRGGAAAMFERYGFF